MLLKTHWETPVMESFFTRIARQILPPKAPEKSGASQRFCVPEAYFVQACITHVRYSQNNSQILTKARKKVCREALRKPFMKSQGNCPHVSRLCEGSELGKWDNPCIKIFLRIWPPFTIEILNGKLLLLYSEHREKENIHQIISDQ